MPLTDSDKTLAAFTTPEGHQGQGKLSMVIWTTTPWTMPANRAVTLAEGLEYALVQVETTDDQQAERVILAMTW